MPDPSLGILKDLVVLFGLATLVVVFCHKVRIPPIIGFLMTGVLAGPSGLRLIEDTHSVELLAEIGVVLLLFSIGLEFSLESLLRLRSLLLVGGGIQVLVTGAIAAAISLAVFDIPTAEGVFIGMLVALSSTAIVLKLLADSGEVDSPMGRMALGILIFQDLCVVPFMIMTPLLAGKGGSSAEIASQLLIATLMVVGSLVGGRYVVPWVLGQVVRTRSRETFLLSVIILCLGTAWLSALAGLSLALGAFIAGLVISQSEYSHQALGEIIPFKDAFASLFLISIGMLLNLHVLERPFLLVLGVCGILGLKAIVAAGAALACGYNARISVISGVVLAQIGEFSFVLAKRGREEGLLEESFYELFLAAAVISMFLTPLLKHLSPAIGDAVGRLVPERWGRRQGAPQETAVAESLRDHVILVGFGLTGRKLAAALRSVNLPYLIIEMNSDTVAAERRRGEPIIYGDASSPEVLTYAGILRARVLVLAISEAASVRRSTELAHRLQPALHIIVRTRYVQEMQPLKDLGASEVVPEDFETSLEIFSRTLRKLLVPRDLVDRFVREARAGNYGLLREEAVDGKRLADASIASLGADLEVVRVQPHSALSGLTLAEAQLRTRSGATVLALRAGETLQPNPPVTTRLEDGISVVLFGTPEQLATAAGLFEPPTPPGEGQRIPSDGERPVVDGEAPPAKG